MGAAVLGTTPAGAIATEPVQDWGVGQTIEERYADVAPVGDDDAVVVGNLADYSAGTQSMVIRRFNQDGALEWSSSFTGSADLQVLEGVAVDADDRIHAVGSAGLAVAGSYGGGADAVVRVVNGDGTPVWENQFGGANDEYLTAVALGADGSVYAVGYADGFAAGGDGATDILVRKYNRSGTVLWTKEYGTALDDTPTGAAVLADGSLVIVGKAADSPLSFAAGNGLRIHVDASGNELSTTVLNVGLSSLLVGVVALPDGGYVVGGYQIASTTSSTILQRFGSDGTMTWDSSTPDNLREIALAKDGTIVATAIPGEAVFEEGVLLGYDPADGSELWEVDLPSSNDAVVTATNDGALFVTYGNVLSSPGGLRRYIASGNGGGGGGGGGGTGFTDVPAGAFYTEAVAWLKAEEITTGTSPTTFSPNDPVTRAQMAAFLHRLAGTPGGSAAAGFSDVPAGAFYTKAVDWLKAEDITTGTSPTTYSPNDPVTRSQMAAFLHRLAGTPEGSPAAGFSDVPTGAFYTKAVDWLKAQGITTGTSPTTYAPNDTVTRAQMAAFLFRMATDSDWDYPGG